MGQVYRCDRCGEIMEKPVLRMYREEHALTFCAMCTTAFDIFLKGEVIRRVSGRVSGREIEGKEGW